MDRLIEIKQDDFAALVTPIKELPTVEVLRIMRASSENGEQFYLLMEKLRDLIAVDLRPAFDLLNMDQHISLISQWIGSNE